MGQSKLVWNFSRHNSCEHFQWHLVNFVRVMQMITSYIMIIMIHVLPTYVFKFGLKF